ncbi:sce7725 family protein [Pseudomonas sp. H9]|uniref:sce7725 family protein n=1 Tax=Pseudomonas sp. H9 TaxID=483968 RepID=UPI001057FD1B|nr:sce7725 family protein [Pseudomonas sp. H9]TDF85197.1 hypothetical protein E1573_06025 [Pseudomonas sp. H9]
MYYPILRGKQFELIALRELATTLSPEFVTPLIEPVRANLKPLSVTINTLFENGITPIVIINPTLGDFASSSEDLYQEIQSLSPNKFTPCIKTKNINTQFTELFKTYKDDAVIFLENSVDKAMISALNEAKLVFINQEKVASNAIPMLNKVVLYKNSFNKQARNADYGARSFYSNLHIEYAKTSNAVGFGDYTILSEDYSESGGPAYVVTIHLSYIDSEEFDAMYVRHFSSFDDESPTNPGGKFKDALKKLVIHVSENPTDFYMSHGLRGLLELDNKSFPGLGQVKKLSLKHHVETIVDYIKE